MLKEKLDCITPSFHLASCSAREDPEMAFPGGDGSLSFFVY